MGHSQFDRNLFTYTITWIHTAENSSVFRLWTNCRTSNRSIIKKWRGLVATSYIARLTCHLGVGYMPACTISVQKYIWRSSKHQSTEYCKWPFIIYRVSGFSCQLLDCTPASSENIRGNVAAKRIDKTLWGMAQARLPVILSGRAEFVWKTAFAPMDISYFSRKGQNIDWYSVSCWKTRMNRCVRVCTWNLEVFPKHVNGNCSQSAKVVVRWEKFACNVISPLFG